VTLAEFRALARPRLAAIEAPAIEADWLWQHAGEGALVLLTRREAGEPLQYLLGSAPFADLMLACRPGVLIPREDTACLVLAALPCAPARPLRVLDLCAGSGCMGLLFAHHRPDCALTFADISPDALALCRDNATACVRDAEFVASDVFSTLPGTWDVILCNPPYIPTTDLPALTPEVRAEPSLALDGGGDGLDLMRRIIAQTPEHLAPGGLLVLEHGDGQTGIVGNLLAAAGFARRQVIEDLAGLPRGYVCMLTEFTSEPRD